MWYIFAVYICPLTPSHLTCSGAKLLSLLTSATLLLGQQCVEFMQLAVRLANYVHFISCSGKEKANMLTHSHTHTHWGLHPSLGQTSGTAAVCVCVRHQGQFIVYLKLWTCETTSCKRWARGGEWWAGVTPRCLVNSTNSTQMRKCDKIYAKVININVVLSRK